jgi:POT family proton-dependent oligopeptide transporter
MASLKKLVRQFPGTFWIANTMELFERWAYYGIFAVLAIYITNSPETGALGLSHIQKGVLMGVFGGIVYFLPVLTGAIADRIGYKLSLFIAYLILISGYFMIGQVESYSQLMWVLIYTAIGAALFKPIVTATITKTTNEKTSSIGFGLFYTIVNIGSFIGPAAAAFARNVSWNYVFLLSALAIAFNMLLLIFFYREPGRVKSDEKLFKSIGKIFRNIVEVLSNFRFALFLIIIIGFWVMYWQLFFTLPVFIQDWLDTRGIYNLIAGVLPWLAEKFATDAGTVNPELILNMDSFFIICFQIVVSTVVMKYKPLNTMIVGIFIASIGLGLWFVFQNALFLFASIFIFAIGEMSSSPKITEYIGRIAPKDKVGLYMGMSFLPLAGGNFLGGLLSGKAYARFADKYMFLEEEISKRALSVPEVSESFSKTDQWNRVKEILHMTDVELTQTLWTNYHPDRIWMVFTSIGVATAICLFLYDKFVLKGRKMN